jgi:hypothetical protein
MHPLRLNGVIGKGPDCEYLHLKSRAWHELREEHLRLQDKTVFDYHQYGVVGGDGDDDDDDDDEEQDDGDDHDHEEEEEHELDLVCRRRRRSGHVLQTAVVEEVEAVVEEVEAMSEEVEAMDLVAEEEPVATTARVSEMEVTRECLGGGGGRSSRTGFRPIVIEGRIHWVLTGKRIEVAPADLSGSDDDCSPF